MKKIFLISVLQLFLGSLSLATHIVGGEFEMIHVDGDRYIFRQIQYFDVVNGNPEAKDQEINASIFRKKDNVYVRSILMFIQSESYVPYTNPKCTNARLITNRIVYSTEVTLNPNLFSDPEGYYMVWERCCRNNIINNIVRPEETGQTFYMEFPPIRKEDSEFRNSTPQLFPPLSDYACVNRFYYVDFRGFDPDGDSLVYSLDTPKNSSEFTPLPTPTPAPHRNVTWIFGINGAYQIPGNPTLNVNENGFLTVTPSEEGLFVFSVKCEEFRDGKKIGEVVRDFQLFVIDCPNPGTPPEIQVKAPASDVFMHKLDTIRLSVEDSKCFDFKIKDKDGNETVTIRALPVNFEANLESILSADIGYLNFPDDTLGVQICLPDCPYLQNEPFIIDVIAQDYTCPQPLMDTLRLIVLVEPPPNQNPTFTQPVQDEITASFTEGSIINIAFNVEDKDLDSLLLYVEGVDFDLAQYGIEIDTLIFENGKIDFDLNWNTDCQTYPFGLKNEFQLKFYVEDVDKCGLDNRDSVTLNITIDLPDNNAPIVLIDNEPEHKELTVRIEDLLNFDIRAMDADPDDQLLLEAIGVGFDLESIGIVFETQSGTSNVGTSLDWQIDCDKINLFQNDVFEILLIVEDHDKCKVPNADTISLTLNVLPPINNPPEIFVNGEVLEDTIFVDAGNFLDLEIKGIDPDGDLIDLWIFEERALDDLGIDFNNESGLASVVSSFGWETNCLHLGEDFGNATYSFIIVLQDHKCIVPLADTLEMIVVVQDEQIDYSFLPPNVYTPNSDDINESYFVPSLPKNNCACKFEGVSIYNRYGREVFTSMERDFHWYGENYPSGVYYYLISYTDFSVKGTITLLR